MKMGLLLRKTYTFTRVPRVDFGKTEYSVKNIVPGIIESH